MNLTGKGWYSASAKCCLFVLWLRPGTLFAPIFKGTESMTDMSTINGDRWSYPESPDRVQGNRGYFDEVCDVPHDPFSQVWSG